MIILDVGSGNTLTNKQDAIRMVKELQRAVPDPWKRKVVLKAQLFESAPPNRPLDWEVYDVLSVAGRKVFRDVTASVFDTRSLKFLVDYKPLLIKVANRPELRHLVDAMPKTTWPVVSTASWQDAQEQEHTGAIVLACVSEYPATVKAYEDVFRRSDLASGISDHTAGFELWDRYRPKWYERHVKLSTTVGPDAGAFATLPQDLKPLWKT